MVTTKIFLDKIRTTKKRIPPIKHVLKIFFNTQQKSYHVTCPRCYKPVFGENGIEETFGHRLCNYVYRCKQSWCKECMSKRSRETLESLNLRRQKNKLLIFVFNHSISKYL